ncbi:hypothetical protein [Fusobacterium vincentii]|jgi:hypothetical protein|uniref:Uncharacterized protein n=1 Tax=Fusobacterium vincentii TaxID=155615 RepID=A0AAJ1CRS8_FUSVC|nr:hypothetical protein [Fusobacterium vincentii]MCW0263050.1 hypothetical protein [Fusobacterium vincentii]STO29881.1 Uncharacterised protein [Fusobacterium vincentii]DAX28601.1 MAG TPA: hypothetical protein [Caudoviricetes sp.]
MAKYTEHLKLVKPEGNEYYNVEQFNQNAELIDKETKKLSEELAKVQEGATKEKKGIVQFGTEEGKALEGMMLARLAGCVGYGGDIQTAGVKDVNYIYYDRNTRKMYKCLNQNSDVSANVANFVPLDNNSLLDRLENLFTNTVELAIKITKSTNIPELKNYKFWFIEISISIHLDRISHQKYTFTTSSAIDFFYNDNFHTLGKYAIQINRNGEVILKGEAVDKGYVKVTIYGIY